FVLLVSLAQISIISLMLYCIDYQPCNRWAHASYTAACALLCLCPFRITSTRFLFTTLRQALSSPNDHAASCMPDRQFARPPMAVAIALSGSIVKPTDFIGSSGRCITERFRPEF